MMSAIQGGVSLKKAPQQSKPKPDVVQKKPGAFGNFAEMAAMVAKQRKERAEQKTGRRESRHEGLDRELRNARDSFRK
jgi:hypothetical protein